MVFGGIGSRTRRGCGSLQRLDASTYMPKAVSALGEKSLLTLLPKTYLEASAKDPVQAWKLAVDTYKYFRQGEDFARNKGSGTQHAGRSRYPEPDTIRRKTGMSSPEHTPRHPVGGFPRADLGLPIIFQFKDGAKDSRDAKGKDPSIQTLQGKSTGKQRFASPVTRDSNKL